MNKLRNVVNNKVAKKTVYDKLAVKVNHIDTIRFVLKTKYVCRKKNPDLENT